MNIQSISNTNFKGYDARTLKGFLMSSNCQNIASEMVEIGRKEGFKIFTVSKGKLIEGLPKFSENTVGLWAQDYWMIVKKKLLGLEYDKTFYAIKNAMNLKLDFTEKICHETDRIRQVSQNIWDIFDEMRVVENLQGRNFKEVARDFETKKMELLNLQKNAHIAGGNVFIIKNNTKDEVLIGENELEKFSIDEIKSIFSSDKVTVLPQMDYHLDLFIRPLDNKRILVADDKKTIQVLEKGLEKLADYITSLSQKDAIFYEKLYFDLSNKINQYKNIIEKNTNPNSDLIISTLKQAGYKPLRVAGRFFNLIDNLDGEITLQHICNYINANVVKNKNGELVYITNKSNIDSYLGLTPEISKKIGFSFEKEFVNSISKYIKQNKIYFIKGNGDFVANEMLTNFMGGIHCACMEIPSNLKIKSK